MNVFIKLSCYVISYGVIGFYKYLCRGKVVGLERLPEQPYIMAANHVSYLDWLVLYVHFRFSFKKKITFIAKAKLFRQRPWRYFMAFGKTIYIDQEKNGLQAMRVALDVLEKGGILGIFPEGTRSTTGRLMKGQKGVGLLASMANVPIVPVGLVGFYKVLPKGRTIPRIARCAIHIGEPIPAAEIKRQGSHERIVTMIMKRIAHLTEQHYDG